jgi:small nuclear ribonucleoprotein (snRNP)-like protein
MITVKDKNGVGYSVEMTDKRIISGELISVNKNMIAVRDKLGNKLQVSKDDPRYLSGELVGVSKGMVWYNNGQINKLFYPSDIIPDDFVRGQLTKKKLNKLV